MMPYRPPMRRGIDHEPQLDMKSVSEVRVPTPGMAVYTRGVSVLVPGWLGLYMYGRIHNLGICAYRLQVQRNFAVSPRANSRRAMASGGQAEYRSSCGV